MTENQRLREALKLSRGTLRNICTLAGVGANRQSIIQIARGAIDGIEATLAQPSEKRLGTKGTKGVQGRG